MSQLLFPERHPVRDFFVLDALDVAPRSDMASMEHPIFSLSTKAETRPLKYTHGENSVEIIPSTLGLPTVFDKDVLIYCISRLIPVAGPTFGFLLAGTVILVGALTFVPALGLGPVLEHFLMRGGSGTF